MGNRRLHPDYRPGDGERECAGDGAEVGGAAGRVGAWPRLTDGPALCCEAEAKRPPRPPAINRGERAARPPAAGVGSPAAGAPAGAPGRRDLDERGPALWEDAARADRAAAVREPRGGGVRAGHLPLDRCLQVSGAPATAGDTPTPRPSQKPRAPPRMWGRDGLPPARVAAHLEALVSRNPKKLARKTDCPQTDSLPEILTSSHTP